MIEKSGRLNESGLSSEKLQALMMVSTDVIYIMSPDWKTMKDLYGRGFLADTLDPDANWVGRYIHPQDQADVLGVIDACIHCKGAFELEHRVLRADGSIGWTYSRAVPQINGQGEITEWIGAASDITERKQMADELKKSRERQTFLLRLSDAMRPLSDPDAIQAAAARLLGEHLGANQVHYAETGGDAVIIRQSFCNGLPPMVESFRYIDFNEQMAKTYRAGQTTVCHDVDRDPAFTRDEALTIKNLGFRAYVTVPRVKQDQGVATFAVLSIEPRAWTSEEIALVEEVAERTWSAVVRARTEAEMARVLSQVVDEREKLRTIINSISDEIWISDTSGNIAMLNPAVQKAHGFEFDGKSISEIVNMLEILEPDGTPRRPENAPLQRALQGKTISGEEIFRNLKTGELRYRQFTCAPIRDHLAQINGSVAVSRDITEAKRIEQKLRESETKASKAVAAERQRLFDVLDQLPAMVCLLRSDHEVVFSNQAFRDNFGESQGRRCYEYCMGEKTEPCAFCESFEVLKTGKPHHWEVVMPDGTVIDAYDHPFTDVDGSRLVLEMDIDITERKQLETELRESESRARDLVSELAEADQNKNRFISVLSHELRNPLQGIVMAQALMKRVPPDSEMARRAFATQERQTAQLVRLVDDLLDVTRISQNKIHLKKERLDLVALIRRTISDYCEAYGEKGVTLQTRFPEDPILLEGDPVRLTQSFGNLLHNALKFTRTGDTVTVKAAMDAALNECAMRVEDTGAGIEPETLNRMFQPFVQSDQTLARTQGGLGLGLSIVKGMVELHGGHVEAESDGIGKGAAFTIHLPMSEQPNESA